MKIVLGILVLALAGCATDMRKVDRDVGAGQPPAYKEGYAAGCDSGYVAAGHPYYKFRKDVSRFAADDLYKQGWGDGYSVCKGQYDAIGGAMRR